MEKRKLLMGMLALWFGLPMFAEVYEGTCGENVRYSLDTETGVLAPCLGMPTRNPSRK